MKENERGMEHGFHQTVAGLLQCNGHAHKYPDHGLVRYYNPHTIHVCLTKPRLFGLYGHWRDAIKAIRHAIEHEFYQNVADLLDCENQYVPNPFRKRTRWNNRLPGNGRFEEHGLARFYSPSNIHVMLHTPRINSLYSNSTDALIAISAAIQRPYD